ncbi:hypothetical protein E2C01_034864 [Portunus trituberculatus]|uniref:Uncharacterized protein n=1 Tax=Portunus trituberculatus TaxID=210409 RepID=A0A5B7F7H9_PORTR|nr:hypothetical protein [Portunus trituberculatus]
MTPLLSVQCRVWAIGAHSGLPPLLNIPSCHPDEAQIRCKLGRTSNMAWHDTSFLITNVTTTSGAFRRILGGSLRWLSEGEKGRGGRVSREARTVVTSRNI